MSVPEQIAALVGNWVGGNRLWLSPEEPPSESASTASVVLVASGQFLALRYAWAHEGRGHEGLLLLGGDPDGKGAIGVWTDSWHVSHKLMSCEGDVLGRGMISVVGAYAAPPGPDWGWRIVVEPDGKRAFRLLMFNLPPTGGEERAVEATYARKESRA
jgi:hypothetical protein